MSECDLPEVSGRVLELLAVEPLQDLRLPIVDVRNLVALEHDLRADGGEPDEEVRGIPCERRAHGPKDPEGLSAEPQDVFRHRGHLRLMFEGVRHEPHVRLPRLGLRDEDASPVDGKLERVPLKAALRDREREVEDALPLRVPHYGEE